MRQEYSISKILIILISLILGGYLLKEKEMNFEFSWTDEMYQYFSKQAEHSFYPNLSYSGEEKKYNVKEWVADQAMQMLPISGYVEGKSYYQTAVEDEDTYKKILEMQAKDENEVDENGKLVEKEATAKVEEKNRSNIDMSIEKLRDFNYLLGNFYTVDSTTTIGPEQLNADDLLGRSMKIDANSQGPKVLIFHTHSQETFKDSDGTAATSIVGIGAYLKEQLEKKGIGTIHHDGVYDLINGKLDRSSAYEFSEAGVRKILEENPSIEVVIDLHRDGVNENTHLVTEVNGKQTAKIMYFNGLSRTKANGDIAYLANPYIQDNLAFSLQMQLASEKMYPGFTRHIYLKGYRYSLHMKPKSLLIEAGAQTNTVEEMKNAMEVLADILYTVVTE